MDHTEERSFTVQIRLKARFAEDYEGEADGFAWHDEFDASVRPRLVRAVLEALQSAPGWRVTPVSRGASGTEVLEVELERGFR